MFSASRTDPFISAHSCAIVLKGRRRAAVHTEFAPDLSSRRRLPQVDATEAVGEVRQQLEGRYDIVEGFETGARSSNRHSIYSLNTCPHYTRRFNACGTDECRKAVTSLANRKFARLTGALPYQACRLCLNFSRCDRFVYLFAAAAYSLPGTYRLSSRQYQPLHAISCILHAYLVRRCAGWQHKLYLRRHGPSSKERPSQAGLPS